MVMARMAEMQAAGKLPMPDPGWVRIQGWPLRHVVAAAYRVRDDKVSGPSWMEDTFFDIDAKLPSGAKADQANEMLQALLSERFGLELRREKRELSGFVLVVGKHGPKLEEAAPPPASGGPEESPEKRKEQAEARFKEMQKKVRSGGQIPGHSRNSFQGIRIAQLAAFLTSVAGGPVVDETGLTGIYNVSLETWPGTDAEPEQSVFSAVEMLGFKLTPRKIPVETLVVDKVSKTPTAN